MADKVIIPHNLSGATLYFQVWDSSGDVWNGSAFESYTEGNWGNYDIALSRQGTSAIYVGAFPSLDAGRYSVLSFEQAGGSPAATDSVIASGDAVWDGTQFADLGSTAEAVRTEMDANSTELAAIKADTNELQTDWTNGGRLDLLVDAILADTNELQTDWVNGGRLDLLVDAILADTSELQGDWHNDGRLDVLLDAILADTNELQTDWTNGGRLDQLIDAIKAVTDDWADAGRLDAILDDIKADTNELQTDWTNGGRLDLLIDAIKANTDDLGDGQRLDLLIDAIKAVTDKVDDTLEDDAGVYRFTENALEQGPGGDATAANQTTIIDAIAALNDVTAGEVTTAVLAGVVDGTLDLKTAIKRLHSTICGKVVRTATDPITLDFYADDDATKIITLTIQTDGSGRTKS